MSAWATLRALPASVWTLGMVSLLMDASSELIHSLLPVFMASVLGASMTTIGLVEGVAEATASFTKVFSGVLSDRLGKRKLLAVLGYAIAAATKPVFPLASNIGWVFAARSIDRVGKGIRGAPRDALIADVVPPPLRGAAYGLRQALDSAGAFLGPLLAVLFMMRMADNIRSVLWIAVVPAGLAVALLIVGVSEPEPATRAHSSTGTSIAGGLPRHCWFVVLLGGVFALARFSEAFLVLRAQDVGLSLEYVPLVLVLMNVVYAASAYPGGAAADRVSRRLLLLVALMVLVAADVVLAAAASPRAALIGASLWGLHMGLTQGLFAALVAETAGDRRGRAFGVFNLVTGGALLLASVLAGELWTAFGAPATFLAGAGLALLAALGAILLPVGHQRHAT